MSLTDKSKSRLSLILVIGVFAVPVIIAKLALTNHWFNEGVTNQGALLEQPLDLKELGINTDAIDKQWLIIYGLPQHCDETCDQTLFSINQSYLALGRETPRVTPLVMDPVGTHQDLIGKLNPQHWQVQPSSLQATLRVLPNQIYIADPLGNVMMIYARPETEQEFKQFSKNLLSDMRKLLKYSRIG
ncbi:hypothetical protein FE810_11135 [Thalassotalea litorea]|uniref:Cytochrome oxidase assembly protein n=1 Tax=Thalassotalea litorea TaxID=2020715 RepID=A0A5R9IN19_9GAMM|nr:hypothetical protein [Thalassotalea litorea]TLU64636.1 hypothetical protein FE810_11135 [Thalassotalea litorea]